MKNEHLIKYKNPIILKDEQGKVKQTIYDLPAQGHTYGKKVVDDPQPIKYVVNGWKQAQNSQKPPPKLKNFQELNRQATGTHVHTAKQQSDFRKTRDLMVNVKQGQKVIPILLPEEQFTYGVSNRPSTPMKLVMGNCYALEAEQKNQDTYARQTLNKSKGGKKLGGKTTKSQALRQSQAQKEKAYQTKPNLTQEFKLSKYTSMNVTKVDTRLK